MIVAAWRTATTKSCGIKVYNCVTSHKNPVTWGEFVGMSISNMIKHPLESVFWYPTGVMRMNRPLNTLQGFFVHYIPAYIIDLFSWAMRKKPM